MFRGTMFSVYLRLVRFFLLANGGSVRVGGGMIFGTRKSWVTIAKYEVGVFNEAKSCNFRKFGAKQSSLKESIDSLIL